MKKITAEEKKIIEIARENWQYQCKMFMVAGRPFTDKTAKQCFLRIAKDYNFT